MIATTLLLALAQSVAAPALTPKEALALAFPDCKIERTVHRLDKKQQANAHKLAGEKPRSTIVRAYRASKKGKLVGTAYFDNHKIRAKAQLLMVAIDPAHKITRVEVLRFEEPTEYRPRTKWFGQFKGKKLDAKLTVKGDIRSLAGATLSARATTSAVRRILAAHVVLYPLPKAKSKNDDAPNPADKPKNGDRAEAGTGNTSEAKGRHGDGR